MRLSRALCAILTAALLCADMYAAGEAERSLALPEEYAATYIVVLDTLSPDGKFAVIVPNDAPDGAAPPAKNHLVALQPFAIIGTLDTERPYYAGQSHGGISAEWSSDSSVALITLAAKWGPGDVFLLELRDGKLTRMTNLLASLHDLLLADFRKAKPTPDRYNDDIDFIFKGEDPVCTLEGTARVRIDAEATNDPKGVAERRWNAHIAATWDMAQARFTRQKITRPQTRR